MNTNMMELSLKEMALVSGGDWKDRIAGAVSGMAMGGTAGAIAGMAGGPVGIVTGLIGGGTFGAVVGGAMGCEVLKKKIQEAKKAVEDIF